MKTNIRLEQCSAGWKVIADIEGATSSEDIEQAKSLIATFGAYAHTLPGWSATGEAPAASDKSEAERNAIRAHYAQKARRNWNRGP